MLPRPPILRVRECPMSGLNPPLWGNTNPLLNRLVVPTPLLSEGMPPEQRDRAIGVMPQDRRGRVFVIVHDRSDRQLRMQLAKERRRIRSRNTCRDGLGVHVAGPRVRECLMEVVRDVIPISTG